ncbi:chemotaxis protein CheW [Carnobacterium antarcticum]|uniref:Chemotaxis protein CheW n=1 Tax=Carnobacterium antarcticum TaxID=2126436 RepID=A0ABW4NKI6_9LACT|nr:chemotaxis protein CheW [Carnobacterium sp. CP1]ALV22069.1 Positive regulator of CheA protein activity [Carnobacterium sp. CP1]
MEKFIVFTSGAQNFAIPITDVEKIIMMEDPTRIPDTSSYLLGAIPYSDRLLPIVDLSERLFKQLTPLTPKTKVIVAEWKELKIGLVVDDVLAVNNFEEIPADEAEAAEEMRGAAKYVRALFKTEAGIILVLDVDALFSTENEKELIELINK